MNYERFTCAAKLTITRSNELKMMCKVKAHQTITMQQGPVFTKPQKVGTLFRVTYRSKRGAARQPMLH